MPWGDQMTTFSRVQSDVKGGPLGWVRWGSVKGPESEVSSAFCTSFSSVSSERSSWEPSTRKQQSLCALHSSQQHLQQETTYPSAPYRIAGFLIVESQKQRTFQPLLNLYTSLFNYLLILSYTCLLCACVCTCAKLHVSRSEGNFKELIPSFH